MLILATALCVREWQNYRERKELLDRIMSVDYQVFKRAQRAGGEARRHLHFPANMTDAELAAASDKKEAQNA